jgi:periplasmic divalent cation tolerance protein
MAKFIVVLSTVPDKAKGHEIAKALVEARLAACVTLSAACRSLYRWEGKISDDREYMLVIKTTGSLFRKLEAKLKAIHPYTVPEIIALPVVGGSAPYLSWLDGETKKNC